MKKKNVARISCKGFTIITPYSEVCQSYDTSYIVRNITIGWLKHSYLANIYFSHYFFQQIQTKTQTVLHNS